MSAATIKKKSSDERPEIKLTCKMATAFLETIPLDLDGKDFTDYQFAAVKHYSSCPTCRRISAVHAEKLPKGEDACRSALLLIAGLMPALGVVGGSPSTLRELWAIEHVIGEPFSSTRDYRHRRLGSRGGLHQCASVLCTNARDGLMSLGVEVATQKHIVISQIFREKGWGLEPMMPIHRRFIEKLGRCDCTENGEGRDCSAGCVAGLHSLRLLEALAAKAA